MASTFAPFRLATLFVFAAGSWAASCSARPGGVAERAIGAGTILWLPASAEILPDGPGPVAVENGRSLYADGGAAVSFTLAGERDQLSDSLVRRFDDECWHQRSTQYLNRQLTTSFREGWQAGCQCLFSTDAHGKPIRREPYYQWRGEWEDHRGNVVTYSLSAEGRRLRGYASYIPKALVDAALHPGS
jgi:hypothetical protein